MFVLNLKSGAHSLSPSAKKKDQHLNKMTNKYSTLRTTGRTNKKGCMSVYGARAHVVHKT